jgi:hypothetical protein
VLTFFQICISTNTENDTNLGVETCMSLLWDIISINMLDFSVECVYELHYQDEQVNEDEVKRTCHLCTGKRMHTEFG